MINGYRTVVKWFDTEYKSYFNYNKIKAYQQAQECEKTISELVKNHKLGTHTASQIKIVIYSEIDGVRNLEKIELELLNKVIQRMEQEHDKRRIISKSI